MIPTDLDNLRIVCYPDPILREKAEPVTEFDENLKAFVEHMYELMKTGEGVGLAAPQVGISARLFVLNPTGEPEDRKVYINPEFIGTNGVAEREEGCLSLPGINVMMRRARVARLRAQDVEGNTFEESGEDLLARIWQHENDHLNGRLIIDNMSAADELANRKAIKQLKVDYAHSR